MSSKSTILLTNENEHWYSDCTDRCKDGKDAITLEFSKKNIRIDLNDSDDLIITLNNPDSEIYKVISELAKQLRGY